MVKILVPSWLAGWQPAFRPCRRLCSGTAYRPPCLRLAEASHHSHHWSPCRLLSHQSGPCLPQVRKLFSRCYTVGRTFPICHVHVGDALVEVSSFTTNADKSRIPRDAAGLLAGRPQHGGSRHKVRCTASCGDKLLEMWGGMGRGVLVAVMWGYARREERGVHVDPRSGTE